jgi:hypothetical protein
MTHRSQSSCARTTRHYARPMAGYGQAAGLQAAQEMARNSEASSLSSSFLVPSRWTRNVAISPVCGSRARILAQALMSPVEGFVKAVVAVVGAAQAGFQDLVDGCASS